MIFRTSFGKGRRIERRAARHEELLRAARAAFGRTPDAVDGDTVELEGITFLFDPGSDAPFAVRPACDRCETTALDQSPLEEWILFGSPVRGQARSTCRDCRFLDVTVDLRASIARAS